MKPSIAVKTFGVRGDDAPAFARKWLPRGWSPKVLLNGFWTEEQEKNLAHGHISRIIKLERFPSRKLLGDKNLEKLKNYERLKKRYKHLRDHVFRWLYFLVDSDKICVTESGGSFLKDCPQFEYHYNVGGSRGLFTATICRLGPNSAMLIIQICESRVAKKKKGTKRKHRRQKGTA